MLQRVASVLLITLLLDVVHADNDDNTAVIVGGLAGGALVVGIVAWVLLRSNYLKFANQGGDRGYMESDGTWTYSSSQLL